MSNKLELSGLFVCLGQLIKFFSTSRDIKNCWVKVCQGDQYTGCHYILYICINIYIYIYIYIYIFIYIGFPTEKDGGGSLPPLSTIWKALIYKVFIVGLLVPAMGHLLNGHLLKCTSWHKTILMINSMAHCFHVST